MKDRKDILQIFSKGIREKLEKAVADFDYVQEIRMRIGGPLLMVYKNKEVFISRYGGITESREEAYAAVRKDIRETVECISSYSLYAFEDELRQGFITIQGGHRVGLAGKTVTEGMNIKTMKFISFINIRLAHEVKGCADKVLPFLYCGQGEQADIYNTMIISPPRCGKTTLLRDIIRQVSDGREKCRGLTAAVVDERSEIAACYQGEPQNDVGMRTDVLDCCPKAEGMMMMIRTMSPEIVAVDEIGSREEMEAIRYASGCGCRLVAAVHGESLEDIKRKPVLREIFEDKIFQRYILLDRAGGPGHVEGIYNSAGKRESAYG